MKDRKKKIWSPTQREKSDYAWGMSGSYSSGSKVNTPNTNQRPKDKNGKVLVPKGLTVIGDGGYYFTTPYKKKKR
jgi:hypothetical protein